MYSQCAETDILAVADLVEVEEALELEEDDGVKLEPFNLAQVFHSQLFRTQHSCVELGLFRFALFRLHNW